MNLKRFLLLLPAAVIAGVVFGQGPLTPPGAPAPAMKSLDQIEPRRTITSLPFTINQPGRFYLTAIANSSASGEYRSQRRLRSGHRHHRNRQLLSWHACGHGHRNLRPHCHWL